MNSRPRLACRIRTKLVKICDDRLTEDEIVVFTSEIGEIQPLRDDIHPEKEPSTGVMIGQIWSYRIIESM